MWFPNHVRCVQIPTPVHGCWAGQYTDPINVDKFQKKKSNPVKDILHGKTALSLTQTASVFNHCCQYRMFNKENFNSSAGVEFFNYGQSALGPLEALVTVGVQNYATASPFLSIHSNQQKPNCINLSSSSTINLNFGINQILSDDFGKKSNEKENATDVIIGQSEHLRCVCKSPRCHVQLQHDNGSIQSSALRAVHAIQPPKYELSLYGSDSLPGPYSILNADNANTYHQKRKRSWSRAVFSNLQRKGLEKRFEVQKYVTKPDRRQLAAMLGLTDAQVKVWFQNRRMKWRHTQQLKEKSKPGPQDDEENENTHLSEKKCAHDTDIVSDIQDCIPVRDATSSSSTN